MTDMWCVSTSPAKRTHQTIPTTAVSPADPYARVEDEYNAWLKDSPSSKQPCKYFSFGGCTRGHDCPYSHDLTVEPKNDEDSNRGFVLLGAGNVANLPPLTNQENLGHPQHQFEQPQFDDMQQSSMHRAHGGAGEWDAPNGSSYGYGEDATTPYHPHPRSWNDAPSAGSQQHEVPQYPHSSRTSTIGRKPYVPHHKRQNGEQIRNMPTHEYAAHQQADFVRRFQDYTSQRTAPPSSDDTLSSAQWEQRQQQQFQMMMQQQQQQGGGPLSGIAVNGTSPQPTKRRMPGQIASNAAAAEATIGTNPSATLFPEQLSSTPAAVGGYKIGKNPTAVPFQPSGQTTTTPTEVLTRADPLESQEATSNFGFRRQQAMRAPLTMSSGPSTRNPPAEAVEVSSRRRPPHLSAGSFAPGAEQASSLGSLGTPFSVTSTNSPGSAGSPFSAATNFPSPASTGAALGGGVLSRAASSEASSPLGAAQLSATEHRKLRNAPISQTTSPWTGAPLAVDL